MSCGDQENARFISTGDALHFNYVVRAQTVQEASSTWGAPFYDGDSSSGSRDCELRLRYTEFDQLAHGGFLLSEGTKFGAIEFTHCRLFNSALVVDTSGSGTLVCGLTNSYWERGDVQFGIWHATGSAKKEKGKKGSKKGSGLNIDIFCLKKGSGLNIDIFCLCARLRRWDAAKAAIGICRSDLSPDESGGPTRGYFPGRCGPRSFCRDAG